MEKGTWVDVHPIASDTGPIQVEFEVKSDGSEIDGGSKVALVNFSLHSLFGQLDIDLNGRTRSNGSSTYPYLAFLETLLSYGEEAKTTHLTSSLFYIDTAGKMDEPDPTKANADAEADPAQNLKGCISKW